MPDYMLLLYERPEMFQALSSQDMDRVVAKYVEWRSTLGAQGKLTGGNKLRNDAGRVIEPKAGQIGVRDGPFVESKEVMGGYFILNAGDYAEATQIAKACPHLLFGGRMELREIEKT